METTSPPEPARGRPHGEFLALAAFFTSGLLALVYEVCWIRKASLAFGSTTFALSMVLAVFFGGLALGSLIFGRLSPRIARPLRVYAIVELGVALLVMLTPLAFRATESIFDALYPTIGASFPLLSVSRLLLLSLILLPPTILMGGTFPLFCRQFVREDGVIGRPVGQLYALNTLGAALGCALCGFVLIPRIGTNLALVSAALVNVGVAVAVWLLPLRAPTHSTPKVSLSSPKETRPSQATRLVVFMLFFSTGFVALGNEVLWAQFLPLLIYNSVYTYTLTLAVTLIGIVIGSLLACRVIDLWHRRALAFGILQAALGVSVLFVLLAPPEWWSPLRDTRSVATQSLLIAALMLLPAVLSGASFPLAIRMVVHEAGDAGPGVGRMTAINTMGGIFGSLAVGFLALPLLGLQATALLTAGLSVLTALAAWLLLESTLRLPFRLSVAAAGLAIYAFLPLATSTSLPKDYLGPSHEMVDYREGIRSHMAVLRRGDWLELEINRLPQGTDRQVHLSMAAHIPMLLHPDPRSVAVVGLGTGQAASRFLMYPIERLDCIEIEPQLQPFIQKHYPSDWMQDPRCDFVVEDGRNYLAHTDQRYDVISIEVGQVFRPGVAGFYTLDFYQQARKSLAPGGVFSQFVPASFLQPDEFKTVVRTFLEAFPASVLWYNTDELLLLGKTEQPVRMHRQRIELLKELAPLVEDADFWYWGGPQHAVGQIPVFLSGFIAGPLGLRSMTGNARVYRDDLPFLEYTTALSRSTAEVQLVELMMAHTESAATMTDWPLEAEEVSSIRSLQRRNLGDIAAAAHLRFAVERQLDAPQQVEGLLRAGLRWNPDSFDLNSSLGRLLHRSARYAEAQTPLQHAVQLRPASPEVQYCLGDAILSTGGDPRAAVASYRAALGSRPDHADTHAGLGVALARLNHLRDAKRHLERALQLAPSNRTANDNLSKVRELLAADGP